MAPPKVTLNTLFTIIALMIYLCDKRYENYINNFSPTDDLPDFLRNMAVLGLEEAGPVQGRQSCRGDRAHWKSQCCVFFFLL